ncbi:MAG: DNA polymerase III subunit alpha, partial [Chloroflexi bacterium]|nr:DNA polymerase III subunit alpha [Chloroflexota bacterium]
QEMADLFGDVPEAISNTQRIAEMCDVEISFDHVHLPGYSTPDQEDPDEYLTRLCWEGLARRLPDTPQQYKERLTYELEVIRHTQFANYFLVVWDIITFAREQDILFGVRGSAAGSLALFCLGVTDVDPVAYGLIFERFLNVERKEMPDIDMDFQDDRRDEVIQHVLHKYGRDHVAQIVTFGTLGPKAAIRDVGRALAMPYADVDRVARLVPFRVRTLKEALEQSPELKGLRDADPILRRLVDTAQQLEGLVRHTSTHAAGVVISQEPLTEYVPLQRPVRGDENAIAMTQFSMEHIAHLGLLKMDFLGLVNLTILKETMKLVEETQGRRMNLQEIPLDDKATFDLLSSGETADVFQLEGAGMRRHIKQLKPSSLREVAAMIALYRPGPMEHIETYIQAKHGEAQVQYPHPSFQELLEETYGIIVYQDQVLQIIQRFAGYSMGEADIVRKAMGKKIPAIMQQERQRFLRGAREQGYEEQDAEAIFQLIEPFAGYAFNKAHAVSYALIAYWTAYFKANHPVAYMTSVLNSRAENLEKVGATVNEARRLRIPVLPPDINHSQTRFAMEPQEDGKTAIRFGLAAVKNVGEGAVTPLVEVRAAGEPFNSVEDLCRRADLRAVNRRTLESLIKVGALDCLGADRNSLIAGLDRILRLSQQETRMRQTGQTTMLDLFGDSVEAPVAAIELPTATAATPREKLEWEQELLGVGFSDNPFSAMAASLDASGAIISVHDITPENAGKRVVVVGSVSSVRSGMTKDGKSYAVAMLNLMGGPLELFAWDRKYHES